MISIDDKLLNDLCEISRTNDRLRINYNLHASHNDPVQRLLNALQPGTTLPVHRHHGTDETFFILKGSLQVKTYNNDGSVKDVKVLDNNTGKYGVVIPAGVWHNIEIFEPDTVIFELKQGPYLPLSPNDILENHH